MATQRAKSSTPSKRAMKAELKTGVKLSVAFCLTYFSVWQVVTSSTLSMTSWPLIRENIDLFRSSQQLTHLALDPWRTFCADTALYLPCIVPPEFREVPSKHLTPTWIVCLWKKPIFYNDPWLKKANRRKLSEWSNLTICRGGGYRSALNTFSVIFHSTDYAKKLLIA